jgi:hypothetical protein
MSQLLARPAICLFLSGWISGFAWSDEFRVDTDIYVGNQKQPVAQNLTIFTSGLVYDFPLTGPEEITVFDPAHGRFVLLDCQRNVKTTLTTPELLKFAAAMKAQALDMGGVVAFAAKPQFEHHFDQKNGRLTLSSDVMTYRMKGAKPKLESVVSGYRNFADWYARLNATRPGNLPPFARIELNKAIAEKGLIPEEVELRIAPKDRLVGRKLVVRSHHSSYWQITNTDRKRIEKAGRYMVSFQSVSFQDYQRELLAASERDRYARK